MKTTEERFFSYMPLWGQWEYTGRYLGKGNMSSGVYEVKRSQFGKEEYAAIKMITVINSQYSSDAAQVIREISIMDKLSQCPNIVKYYDSQQKQIFDDSGRVIGSDILIRMERLTPIDDIRSFSPIETMKLGADICNALSHAHANGVIHRDVKPANILKSDDGVYKLGDFGIAKVFKESSYNYTTDIGTAAYAAPEMRKQSANAAYTGSADTYSLGIIMYQLLNNGLLPFMKSDDCDYGQAIEMRLAGNAFPPPANGTPHMKRIVMKACSFAEQNRYLSADELHSDIVSALNSDAMSPFNATVYAQNSNEKGLQDSVADAFIGYPYPPSAKSPENSSKSDNRLKALIAVMAAIVLLLAVGIGIIVFLTSDDNDKKDNGETATAAAEEDDSTPISTEPTGVQSATQTMPAAAASTAAPTAVSNEYYVLSAMTDSSGTTIYAWGEDFCIESTPDGTHTFYTFAPDGKTTAKSINGEDQPVNGTANASCSYDSADRLIRKETTGCTETYTYNSDGALSRYTKSNSDSSGQTVDYYFEDGKLVKSVSVIFNSSGSSQTTTLYNYDALGRLVSETWVSGSRSGQRTYTYEKASREQYNMFIGSEVTKAYNIRINIFTLRLITDTDE